MLTFHRSREMAPHAGEIFQELNRSLVSCQKNFSGFPRATVYLHSDREEPDVLLGAVNSLFEREVVPLHPHLEKPGCATDHFHWRLRGLVAAVGAAERMM